MTNRTCRTACAVAAAVVLLLAGGSVARAGICMSCSNSATVGDGIVFDELNVKGKPPTNPGPGPWILDKGWVLMGDGTTKAKLKVERHFLTAVAGSTTYSWQELEGMTFSIGMADGRQYKVRLTEVRGCLHTRGTKDTIATPAMKAPPAQPAPKDTKAAKDMKAPPPPPAPPAQPAPKAMPATKDTKVTKDTKEGKCTAITFWVPPYEEIPQYFFEVQKTKQRNPKDKEAALNKFNAKLKRQGKELVTEMPDDRLPTSGFDEQLCKGEFLDKDVLWDKVKASAFAFEGDHYNKAKKTVHKADRSSGLFNLACYGAAPAKMHLLRHTTAGSDPTGGPARTTTFPQRTAMLKAITADYCGDGRAWTADGTELQWTDAKGWFTSPDLDLTSCEAQSMIEGVWGAEGALCLNKPRRLARSTPALSPPPPEPPAELRGAGGHSGRSEGRLWDDGLGSSVRDHPAAEPHYPRRTFPSAMILCGSPPGRRRSCPAARARDHREHGQTR